MNGENRFVCQINEMETICTFDALTGILINQKRTPKKIDGKKIFKADLIIHHDSGRVIYYMESPDFDPLRKEIRLIIDAIDSDWWQTIVCP